MLEFDSDARVDIFYVLSALEDIKPGDSIDPIFAGPPSMLQKTI